YQFLHVALLRDVPFFDETPISVIRLPRKHARPDLLRGERRPRSASAYRRCSRGSGRTTAVGGHSCLTTPACLHRPPEGTPHPRRASAPPPDHARRPGPHR